MELPEKIYIDANENPNDVWLRAFRPPFVKHNSIEYIRTDVVIEKAVMFLKNWDAYRVCLEGHKDWFIEQFENYMKGE